LSNPLINRVLESLGKTSGGATIIKNEENTGVNRDFCALGEESSHRHRFVYYVTGRGFGHATRTIEVCKHLLEAGHEVCICSTVPEYVFKRELPRLHFRHCEMDTSVIQHDALTVAREGSLEHYFKRIHRNREEILEREARFLEECDPDCVVVDAAPLACVAGKLAGKPVACVTNFRWDHVYQGLLDSLSPEEELSDNYQDMIDQIVEDYHMVDEWLKLPSHHPMPEVEEGGVRKGPKVCEVPLVVRRPHRGRHQARKEINLPPDYHHLAILSVGDHDHPEAWNLKDEYLPDGWRCLVIGLNDRQVKLGSKFHMVCRDAYIPDLMMAADVIVGKLGYSTMAELLCCKRPCVYFSREHWLEERYLIDLLNKNGVVIPMPSEDFIEGKWASYLEEAIEMNAISEREYRECCDGGKVVAGILEQMAETRKIHKNK